MKDMSMNADFDESIQYGPVGSHTLLLQTRYPVVATSRLRLRPFTLVDISALIRAVATHRIADATLAVPRPFDARQARRWIESHAVEWRRRCALHWAVTGLDHDRLAGYVGLHDIQLQLGHANLSFWIADRLARKELTIEAAQVALAFAFTTLQLEAVNAHLLGGNPLMARVLRRLGMKSDTATLQTESRWGRSEEVLLWSISKATWMASLQDSAAH
jgi:[ribosomal protein S5]-alanine N-acetyltransferase